MGHNFNCVNRPDLFKPEYPVQMQALELLHIGLYMDKSQVKLVSRS